MSTITFVVPICTSNPLNGSHQHWSVKSRKRKAERAAVARAVAVGRVPLRVGVTGPLDQALADLAAPGLVSVRLIRTKPRGGPMDGDGLAASLKSVRDGVALALGIDDGDTARVRFDYAEERGEWGVRVEVRRLTRVEADHAAEERIIAAAAREGHRIPVENLRAFVEDIAQRADRANAKRASAKVRPTPATYRPGAR